MTMIEIFNSLKRTIISFLILFTLDLLIELFRSVSRVKLLHYLEWLSKANLQIKNYYKHFHFITEWY